SDADLRRLRRAVHGDRLLSPPARLLIRPWCPCGIGLRRVLETTPCPRCDRRGWAEKHVPAFVEIEERSDGWYGRQELATVSEGEGPFTSRELAASVRYDHCPGYLLCGRCGFEDLEERVVVHYAVTHPAFDEQLAGEDLGGVKQILW